MERKLINFINSPLENEFKKFLTEDVSLRKNYLFIALSFKGSEEDINKICEAVNDILVNVCLAKIDDKLIVFLYDELELDFFDFIQNLEYDVGLKIGAFKSGMLSNKESQNFFKYFLFYQMYLANKNQVSNISDLIIDIATIAPLELYTNKRIFLNKINSDEQYQKLIFSLLKNNLNVTKTAKDVYMHRNTINNKIETIKEETGLNVQNFYDAMAIYILMKK